MPLRGLNRAPIYLDILSQVFRIASYPARGISRRTFISTPTLRNIKDDDPSEADWLEEIYDPITKKLRVDSSNESDREDIETELRRKIAQLEGELVELRNQDPSSDDDFLSALSEKGKDRALEGITEMAREALKGFDVNSPELNLRDDGMQRKDPSLRKRRMKSRATASDGDAAILEKFNALLAKSASSKWDPITRKELWRWYSRCKLKQPSFSELLSEHDWNVLWTSQGKISVSNPDRMPHLKILAEDIIASGGQLTGHQHLLYIEALYLAKQESEAIKLWADSEKPLGLSQEFGDSFWMLGVRMYAAIGDPHRAEAVAFRYLDSLDGNDARVFLPIIKAWNQSQDPAASRKAWTLYLHLKERLGQDMKMEDYDEASLSFLSAGKKGLALAVFKDMMISGESSTDQDSTNVYKRALGIVGDLRSLTVDAAEANKISLEALTALPRKLQNKFFYGSWMKKLIGMGEVDSAAMVIELMYERGVQPDSKHMNGIIGAWLRSGNATDQKKAEAMAQDMIQERLEFTQRRRYESSILGDKSKPTSGTAAARPGSIPNFVRRQVPPATIETFSVLVLYYLRRGQHEKISMLNAILAPAEIEPNAYFMNHLMFSDFRSGGHRKAWSTFKELTLRTKNPVKPDLETFLCLWDCMKFHVDKTKNRDSHGFPTCRKLFSKTMAWFENSQTRAKKEDFTQSAYNEIVRCFSLAEDQGGTLVALHAMNRAFGLYPDKDTARIIVLQIARLGADNARARRLNLSSKNTRLNVAKAAKVLETLAKRRRGSLEEKGIDIEAMDSAGRGAEDLFLVSELLRIAIARDGMDPEGVAAEVKRAAYVMGMEGLETGDYLSTQQS